ncbi:MAG: glutathione S-transferase family protein [Oleiphilaceae bacterium]|nr:glutathione S-transferase family protein [Oleiphilaceae bacterium]
MSKIVLHQYRRMFGMPNLSPFCLKVETWLRMLDLDYDIHFQDDPRKAPLGKLPMVDVDGVQVPDSTLIIDYLEETLDQSLDHHLSERDKAISHAFQRMCEERLYWAGVYNRWLDNNWPQVREAAFGGLPFGLRQVVATSVQKKIRRDLNAQGLGLHERATIYEFACRDIDALASLLGKQQFMFGDKLSTLDAVAFAFIATNVQTGLPSPMADQVARHPNLADYHQRIGRRFFAEFY